MVDEYFFCIYTGLQNSSPKNPRTLSFTHPAPAWQHRIWKHLGQSSSKVFFIYVHTASFQQNVPILIGNELPTFFQNTFLLCSTNGSRHAQDTIINEADAMSLTATQDLLPHAPGARRMVVTPHSFRTNAHYKDTTPSILKRLCRRRFKG